MESKGRAFSFCYEVEKWERIFADPVVSVMMHLDVLRFWGRGTIASAKPQKSLPISDTKDFNVRSVILACSLGSAWIHICRKAGKRCSEMRGIDKAWRQLQSHSLLPGDGTAVPERGRCFSWEHNNIYQLSKKRNGHKPAACVYMTTYQLYSNIVIKAVGAIIVMLLLFSSLLPILHYKNYTFHVIRSVSYLIIPLCV